MKIRPRPEDADPTRRPAALPVDLAQSWLALQCRMVPGVSRGVVFIPPGREKSPASLATWPSDSGASPETLELAKRIVCEGRGLAIPDLIVDAVDQPSSDAIAAPIRAGGNIVGVVVLLLTGRTERQRKKNLQLIQWGCAWISALLQRESEIAREADVLRSDFLMAVVNSPCLQSAAMHVVNRIAERFACERVSLGLQDGHSVSLQAISHMANFDPRTALVRQIEADMRECMESTPPAPTNGDGNTHRVPIPGKQGPIGALTLERSGDDPFDENVVSDCRTIAGLIGPILEIKRHDGLSVTARSKQSLKRKLTTVLRPSKTKRWAAAVAAIVLVLALTPGEYKVSAPATIEGEVRRVLVAPQSGFVEHAPVRAGDLVKKDELMALLDNRDLTLKLMKARSEKSKAENEYLNALASGDRVELGLQRARIEQLEAELRLVEGNLKRTRLEAPFDGIVVSGDLSQSLGAPVEIGQVLFEIAPLENYRVVLEVDEQDMANIEVGKPGRLVTAAFPDRVFTITLQQIVPVATATGGRNFFRVEATLDEASEFLRPGMQGVAKITMGRRSLLWIWTHRTIDRLRLWFWSHGL